MVLLALAGMLLSASICSPFYLSDRGNSFFKDFVNHELLSFLGLVVTITLASAANLHLELNKIEERTEEKFSETRVALRRSASALISLFAIAFILVMLKPIFSFNDHIIAMINSFTILIIVFNLAVLGDLTMAVFKITPIRG